jgi:hypothetical protein
MFNSRDDAWVTPKGSEFVDCNAGDWHKDIKRNVIHGIEFLVDSIERASSSAFSLSSDTCFTLCHLLPFLLSDGGDGVVADSERSSDCPLGVASGECVDDSLPDCQWTEFCIMTFDFGLCGERRSRVSDALGSGAILAIILLDHVRMNT